MCMHACICMDVFNACISCVPMCVCVCVLLRKEAMYIYIEYAFGNKNVHTCIEKERQREEGMLMHARTAHRLIHCMCVRL